MHDEPKSPQQQIAFYDVITEALYKILRLDGGEWASPEAVDEVLDTINHFEKRKSELRKLALKH